MSLPSIEQLQYILDAQNRWRSRWHAFVPDATLNVDGDTMQKALDELFGRLENTYPFFHPSYAGQMLKPPHPAAVLGYFAAMLMNPNNHALDGGPATGQLEKEVTADIAAMFGYGEFLGHLTSSGTIANLEALWVSRQLHPGKAIAFSEQSHYTHSRMCEVLGVRGVEIPCDAAGKMDVAALRSACVDGNIGTVVATIGTTGLGALDPLPQIMELQKEFPFRIHVDTAYGGFFTLIAHESAALLPAEIFDALPQCDSIVVDPHKHGLQPYGCGCVLFRDPSTGSLYKHDSPYTYFTSKELHLGEISLECSRAGASAAALWFTLRCLPLKSSEGLGPVLLACRSAALEWAALIRNSEHLSLLLEPELDILTYFSIAEEMSASAISDRSDRIFQLLMDDPQHPVYVSKLRVRSSIVVQRFPELMQDQEWTTVLRSTLMKPEHEQYISVLHGIVEACARSIS